MALKWLKPKIEMAPSLQNRNVVLQIKPKIEMTLNNFASSFFHHFSTKPQIEMSLFAINPKIELSEGVFR
jgi:hypothetical protein